MEGQGRDRGLCLWPLLTPWSVELDVVRGWRPWLDQLRAGGEGRDVGQPLRPLLTLILGGDRQG